MAFSGKNFKKIYLNILTIVTSKLCSDLSMYTVKLNLYQRLVLAPSNSDN